MPKEKQAKTVVEQQINTNTAPVKAPKKPSNAVMTQRVIRYITSIIVGFLILRVIFLMLGANPGNGFVDFIYSVGGFFSAPFRGIFGVPSYGQFYLDTASLVAMIVYMLLAGLISRGVTLSSDRQSE